MQLTGERLARLKASVTPVLGMALLGKTPCGWISDSRQLTGPLFCRSSMTGKRRRFTGRKHTNAAIGLQTEMILLPCGHSLTASGNADATAEGQVRGGSVSVRCVRYSGYAAQPRSLPLYACHLRTTAVAAADLFGDLSEGQF